MTATQITIRVGDTWRHKRESWREIYVRGRQHDGKNLFVSRNTSRRRQAISVATLMRNYRLHEAGDGQVLASG